MSSSLVEFSNELANLVERTGAAVLGVPQGGRQGVSATVWQEGVAVTSAHTIRGLDEVDVVLPSGAATKAPVVGRDFSTDLAVLRLGDAPGPAVLADESQARVGEIVLSVGRRVGDGLAATYGILSAVGGSWRTAQGARIDRWLRLDLNPFPGFSGGPVVNVRGEVLGMATSGPRRTAAVLPSTTVSRVVNQLLQKGRIARGYIGVGLQPVAFPESATQSLGLTSPSGLLIVMIEPGGPAAQAGVVLGDILVRADGAVLKGAHSLQPSLDGDRIGQAVELEFVRAGQIHKASVVVAERPER